MDETNELLREIRDLMLLSRAWVLGDNPLNAQSEDDIRVITDEATERRVLKPEAAIRVAWGEFRRNREHLRAIIKTSER